MKLLVTSFVLIIFTTQAVQCQNLFGRGFDSPEDLFDDSRENNFGRSRPGRFQDSPESREDFRSFNSVRPRNNFGNSRGTFGTRRFQDSIESREIPGRNTGSQNNFRSRSRLDDSRESHENHGIGFRGFSSPTINAHRPRTFVDSHESDENRFSVRQPFNQRTFNAPNTNVVSSRRRFRDSIESNENLFNVNRQFQPRAFQTTNTFNNRLDDSHESDESRFRTRRPVSSFQNNFRRNQNRFRDSIESEERVVIIPPTTTRRLNHFNVNNLQSRNTFGRRDSLEDSFEIGGRRNFQARNRFGTQTQHRFIDSPEDLGFTRNSVSRGFDDSPEDHFGRKHFRGVSKVGRIDSPEDLLDDLFDDDLEDRIRAQNALKRIGVNQGFNHFSTAQHKRPQAQNHFSNRFGSRSSFGKPLPTVFNNNNNRVASTNRGTSSGRPLPNTLNTNQQISNKIRPSGRPLPTQFKTSVPVRTSSRGSIGKPLSTTFTRRNQVQTTSKVSPGRPLPSFTQKNQGTSVSHGTSGIPLPSTFDSKDRVVSTGPGSFQFNTPVGSRRTTQNRHSTPKKPSSAFSFNKRIGSPKITKSKIDSSTFNRIRSNPFSTAKAPGITGFKWPDNGVSGFYVSMSTNNQPATSYFVQLDD